MIARSASGPLFMLSWNFFCMTPMTVNGRSSSKTVLPTGSSLPNSSSAISFPRNSTRRFSSRSRWLMKRLPARGNMRRISSKAG